MFRCVVFLAVLLAGTGAMPLKAQMTTSSPSGATTPARALDSLFADEWERGLREHPESASAFGDTRYGDRWTDLSPSAIASREAPDRSHAGPPGRTDRMLRARRLPKGSDRQGLREQKSTRLNS